MIIKMDSEKIAEVRNALQIIMGNAELIIPTDYSNWRKVAINAEHRPRIIIKQAKRIDSLLPPVKFEG